MNHLTHFNEQGRAKMVDISDKADTVRTAVAKTSITINQAIYQQINDGSNKKGDVLAVAQVAGIMAAKQTSSIIPMCHPISLTGVNIDFEWKIDVLNNHYEIMIEAADKNMVIGRTMLWKKSGGKNGDFEREHLKGEKN